MKLKIKIKILKSGCYPQIMDNGEWFDLKAGETVALKCPEALTLKRKENIKSRDVLFSHCMIPLGVAMKLPKGMEAIVVPRSSLYKRHSCIMSNSLGVIDNSFSGNNDEWHMPVLCFGDSTIERGERLAQFRIQPSQKAGILAKLKWLLSSGVKFEIVDNLDNADRGGFGSTGKM